MDILILILPVIFSLAGAWFTQLGASSRSIIVPVTGYIFYILSFSVLYYAMYSQSIRMLFSVWALGNVIGTGIIGLLFFKERFNWVKLFSLLLICAGLTGIIWNATS